MRAEVAVDCQNRHGEGVLWSAEHALLYWTDIDGRKVWTYDPSKNEARSFDVPGRVCCFAPRRGKVWSELVAAFADGFAFLDIERGERRHIADFEPDKPQTRLNDGRTDRRGRFIAGGMNEAGADPISSVWRLDPDLTLTKLIDGIGVSNSICFSPDGEAMYFTDSTGSDLFCYPYHQETGSLGQRRKLATLEAGRGAPDGSCIDAEGFLWTAVWEGYRVERRAPDGRLDRVIEVPVRKPSCCAFGGADLSTLFITTSRQGEKPEALAAEPQAGNLFAVRPGVNGLADMPFAG